MAFADFNAVLQTVTETVTSVQPTGVDLEVIRSRVRETGGFWEVPVRSNARGRTYEVCESLERAEEVLGERDLKVVFVPIGSGGEAA